MKIFCYPHACPNCTPSIPGTAFHHVGISSHPDYGVAVPILVIHPNDIFGFAVSAAREMAASGSVEPVEMIPVRRDTPIPLGLMIDFPN